MNNTARRHHNDPEVSKERRGRPSKLTAEDIHHVEQLLQEHGWTARSLTWDQLAIEAGLEVSGLTLRRAMGTMDYHKCVAWRKGWVNEQLARYRVDFAKIMLERYPTPDSWRRVRFSDEVHFGWGPTGAARIIRRPGERYCKDCIQETNEPDEKAKKRFHCWAAAGHNFKSDLHFYDAGNSIGKMNQATYVGSILEPIVKPWLLAGHVAIIVTL